MTAYTSDPDFRSNVKLTRAARWVKGGNIASVRALSDQDYKSLMCLDDTRLLLNSSFGLNLRADAVFDARDIVKNVKQFCGELLDRCTPNHWKTTLRRAHVCMNTRWAVGSSLFSIRKCLTSSKPSVDDYVSRMIRPSPPVDPDFLIFASAEIGRIFETGWDSGYWNAVKNFTPPTKSNLDKRTKGTYRDRATKGDLGRDLFKRWAGGTVTDCIPSRVRALEGLRRNSADFSAAETAAFLRSCGLCNRRLGPGRDTFMYRSGLVRIPIHQPIQGSEKKKKKKKKKKS